MGDATNSRPKCLALLAGRTLLEWQVDALHRAGLEAIALVTGYRSEMLPQVSGPRFHNPQWESTNMVASLLCADAWLRGGTTVVSYGDIVYHPGIVEELCAVNEDIAITYDVQWRSLWKARFGDPLRDAETFQVGGDGLLRSIGRRPESEADVEGQYMGLLKFTASGWGSVRDWLTARDQQEVDAIDMTGLLDRLVADGFRIATLPVSGRWCEVDSQDDLRLYETLLRSARPWPHDWRT